MQRAKNEDSMQKAQREFMEREKRHLRTSAMAQEEVEWERRLRVDAHELLEFVEVERRMHDEISQRRLEEAQCTHDARRTYPDDKDEVLIDIAEATDDVFLEEQDEQLLLDNENAVEEDAQDPSSDPEQSHFDHRHLPEIMQGAPRIEQETFISTPAKQRTMIPVDFGDDKENQTPITYQGVLQSLTIDRAAALAAIQYRRGRAKSFAQNNTPRKINLTDRRDISAPPLVTMSVGRKK